MLDRKFGLSIIFNFYYNNLKHKETIGTFSNIEINKPVNIITDHDHDQKVA